MVRIYDINTPCPLCWTPRLGSQDLVESRMCSADYDNLCCEDVIEASSNIRKHRLLIVLQHEMSGYLAGVGEAMDPKDRDRTYFPKSVGVGGWEGFLWFGCSLCANRWLQ